MKEIFEQFLSGALSIPGPIRDRIAGVISSAYEQEYRSSFGFEDPGLKGMEAFYAGDYQKFSETLGKPADPQGEEFFNLKVSNVRRTVGFRPFPQGQLEGTRIPEIAQARNVRELSDVLVRSHYPGIASIIQRKMQPGTTEEQVGDMLGNAAAGIYDAVARYSPSKGKFSAFALKSGVLGGLTSSGRSAQAAGGESIPDDDPTGRYGTYDPSGRIDYTVPTPAQKAIDDMRRAVLNLSATKIPTGLYGRTNPGGYVAPKDLGGEPFYNKTWGNRYQVANMGLREIHLTPNQIAALTGTAVPQMYKKYPSLLNFAPNDVREAAGIRLSKYGPGQSNLDMLRKRANYILRQHMGSFGLPGTEFEDNPDLMEDEALTRSVEAEKALKDAAVDVRQDVSIAGRRFDVDFTGDALSQAEMIRRMQYGPHEVERALADYRAGKPLLPKQKEMVDILLGGIGNPDKRPLSRAAQLREMDQRLDQISAILSQTQGADPLQYSLGNQLASEGHARGYMDRFFAAASPRVVSAQKAIYASSSRIARDQANKERAARDLIATGQARDLSEAYRILNQRGAALPVTASNMPPDPEEQDAIANSRVVADAAAPPQQIAPGLSIEQLPPSSLEAQYAEARQKALDAKTFIQENFPEYEAKWMGGDASQAKGFERFRAENPDFSAAYADLMYEHWGDHDPNSPRYLEGRRGDVNNPSVFTDWISAAKPYTTGDFAAVDSSGKVFRYGTKAQVVNFIKENPGIRLLSKQEYEARAATGRYYKPKPGKSVLYGMDIPGRVAPYEEVFPDSTKRRGVARRNEFSYVRNPVGGRYLPQEDFLHKYQDAAGRVRNLAETFEGAAMHETGHQVWFSMGEASAQVNKKFADLFKAAKEAGIHITQIWEEKGINTSASEEFAQAYASSRLFGVDALRKAGYETYARFFEDYGTHVSLAESYAPPVIDYRDPSNPKAFRVRMVQDVMEANLDDFGPDLWMEDPSDAQAAAEGLRAAPRPTQAAAEERARWLEANRTHYRQRYGVDPELAETANSLNPKIAYRSLIARALTDVRVRDPNNPGSYYTVQSHILPKDLGSAVRSGDRSSNYSYGVTDPRTGEVTEIANNAQVAGAVNAAKDAVQTAFNGQGLPTNPKEMLATLTKRIDKFIGEHYDKALKEAGTSEASIQSVNAIKDLTKSIAKNIVGTVADGMTATGQGVRGYQSLAYNAVPVNNAASLQALMAANPAVAQAVQNAGGINSALASGGIVVGAGNSFGGWNIGGSGYNLGGGSLGGVGGGGGSGGGGGGSRNMWGGGLGQFLYGAYVAKRFLSWTIGSMGQETKQLGQEQAAIGAWATPEVDASVGTAGYNVRQAAIDRYFAKGVQETIGGFQSLKYGMIGGDGTASRLWAGARVAGAIGGAGFAALQAGAMLSSPLMQGLGVTAGAASGAGAIGAAVAPIALTAAATYGAVTLGMEGYNAWLKPPGDRAMTPGVAIENLQAQYYQEKAAKAAMNNPMLSAEERQAAREMYQKAIWSSPLGITAPGTGANARASVENIDRYLTAEQAAIAKTSNQVDRKFVNAQKWADAIERITGEAPTEVFPALMALDRSLAGGLTENLALGTATAARRGGYTTSAFVQTGFTTAEQLGIGVGKQGFDQFWGQWSTEMSEADRAAVQKYAGQVSRYGGMLSGYYANPTEANALVRQYGLFTQASAQAVQQGLSIANTAGWTGESIAAYQVNAGAMTLGGKMTPVTVGDYVAQQAARVGNVRMGFINTMSNALVEAGVPWLTAQNFGEQYGIVSQAQISNASGAMQLAQQFGIYNPSQLNALAASAVNMPTYKAQAAGNIAALAYQAGYGASAGVGINNFVSGLDANQVYQYNRVASGDLGAMSYLANKGQLPAFYQSQNLAGRPIYETNMGGFLSYLRQGQAAMREAGIPYKGNLSGPTQTANFSGSGAPTVTSVPLAQQIASYLGSTDAEGMQALATGGVQAYQALHTQRQAQFSLASAGNAMAGVAEQQRYLWGGSKGSWDKPAPGSLWALENTQREMQHSQQMADFAANQARMFTQNKFAMQGEAIQYQRMQVSQGYQRWQVGFEQQGAMLQRSWAQEDWQYQDQSRAMNFGWQMEDYDEAIRFSKGRDRRKLVRQRDRAVATQNMEEEQIDKQRERQEQLWAREDERMSKQMAYQESLMKLEIANFDLQKEQRETFYEMDAQNLERQKREYEANFELQSQIIHAQREHQKNMLDLQRQAAGVQAAAAKEQIEYAKNMETITTDWQNRTGELKTTMENMPLQAIEALNKLGLDLDKLNSAKIADLGDAMDRINSVNMSGLDGTLGRIESFIRALSTVNSSKISALIRLLSYTD